MNLPPRASSDSDPTAITIEQARERIERQLPRFAHSELIACADAQNRVCVADTLAALSVPSFRASAMDGYAIRIDESDRPLHIAGQSLAGHPGDDSLAPYTCQRITTGARVPDQADTVVQQENVTVLNDTITITVPPHRGLHVRNPGTDTRQNSRLIPANTRLGAAELALLASHGITDIEVFKPLRIALFSTGDELVDPGQSRETGQIYDANRPLLMALLRHASVQVDDLGICIDTESALEKMIAAAHGADLVISSGGVSVGDADHVRTVLERHGQVDLWKIAMKPGRPLTFGFSGHNQAYFGLPGNPVSAALTCLLFVLPAIRHMLGIPHALPPALVLPLQGTLNKNPGRVEYQRALMSQTDTGDWQVETTGLQDSHVLSSLHSANCLIELATHSSGAEHGDRVKVYPFTHFADAVI